MKPLEFSATDVAVTRFQHLSLALLGFKIWQLEVVIGFVPE